MDITIICEYDEYLSLFNTHAHTTYTHDIVPTKRYLTITS